MRILVCVKRVPAPGSKINVTSDSLKVDTSHLGFTTSPHEECAVEEAAQLIEQHGGSVTVLTVGPSEAEEQLRYAASVGATDFVLVTNDTGVEWDPQQTAEAIVQTVTEIEAEEGQFDLILFGNESADSGGHQVGIRVAVALSRPAVNGIKGIEVEATNLTARRGRSWLRGLLPANSGRAWRQRGDQSAKVPDHEGTSRFQKGRNIETRVDSACRASAADTSTPTRRDRN